MTREEDLFANLAGWHIDDSFKCSFIGRVIHKVQIRENVFDLESCQVEISFRTINADYLHPLKEALTTDKTTGNHFLLE